MRALRRLDAIAELVEPVETVADIGCDHGFLGKILIKSGKANKVIAVDINSQSLSKTERLAQKVHLKDKIETRLGDGLNPIKDFEVDIVVIAGLGGRTIIDILEAKQIKGVKEFIFQPSQKSEIFKDYLQKNKFKIICDFIVKDKNKFYNTIKAVKVESEVYISEEEKLFCLTDFDQYNDDLLEYIEQFIQRNNQIYLSSKDEKTAKRLEIAKRLKEKIIKRGI